MRKDLLDAFAVLEWAKSHIPNMRRGVSVWRNGSPYEVVEERDRRTGEKLIVLCRKHEPDRTFNAETGAVINAINSALDLLTAALARRNGAVPTDNTHFPIHRREADFLKRMKDIGRQNRLSRRDIDKIIALKPYEGGHDLLWPFRRLDNLRKHERLVALDGIVQAFFTAGSGTKYGTSRWQRFQKKTLLFRVPADAPSPEPRRNLFLAFDIVFDEATGDLSGRPVVPMLEKYGDAVADIIDMFDHP
jgi:hypothetical protein